MKKALLAAIAVWLVGAPSLRAQEPNLPPPEAAHQWLNQLVGEWKIESTAEAPNGEVFQCHGKAKAESLGGFWVILTIDNQMGDETVRGVMTVGYDPKSKKYIGTWVDSMQSYLWKYEGTLDASGKVLPLEALGPNMLDPSSEKLLKFRDTIEIKDKDHFVLVGSVEAEPGKWVKFMTMNFRRTK